MPLDLNHSVLITLADGQVIDIADPVSNQNRNLRSQDYADLGMQLNYLYDDIQAGVFGEPAKTGKFASHLKEIKDKYPVTKPQIPKDQ